MRVNLSWFDGVELEKLLASSRTQVAQHLAQAATRGLKMPLYHPQADGSYSVRRYGEKATTTSYFTVKFYHEQSDLIASCDCQPKATKNQPPCRHILLVYDDYLAEEQAKAAQKLTRATLKPTVKTARLKSASVKCLFCGLGMSGTHLANPVCNICTVALAYGNEAGYEQLTLIKRDVKASYYAQTLAEEHQAATTPRLTSGFAKAETCASPPVSRLTELAVNITTLREVDAVVNPVNLVGVMGRGVALAFREALPTTYFEAYQAACQSGKLAIGRIQLWRNYSDDPKWVLNFPTKTHWRSPSRLSYIEAGLAILTEVIRDKEISTIALPRLGCGNGGLEWQTVKPLIETAFAKLPNVKVIIANS